MHVPLKRCGGLACDMVILDLEDSVKDEDKPAARAGAVAAMQAGFPGKITAIRVNAVDSRFHADDLAAVAGAACDLFVLPKVEDAADAARVAHQLGRPVYAMIETPLGVRRAYEIAAEPAVVGLIMGNNDLAHVLHPARRSGADRPAICDAGGGDGGADGGHYGVGWRVQQIEG